MFPYREILKSELKKQLPRVNFKMQAVHSVRAYSHCIVSQDGRSQLHRLGRAQVYIALWASPCACALSDLKCPKVYRHRNEYRSVLNEN